MGIFGRISTASSGRLTPPTCEPGVRSKQSSWPAVGLMSSVGTSAHSWSRSANDSRTANCVWYSVSVSRRCIWSRFQSLRARLQGVEPEFIQPVLFAKELLGNVRQDGVLPDARDPGVVEIGAHE